MSAECSDRDRSTSFHRLHPGLARVLATLALAPCLVIVGCTNAGKMKSEADDLQRAVEQLRTQQADYYAPREFAAAESNLDFFFEEYDERDYWDAQEVLAVARENVKKAQEITTFGADRDRDGIPDVDDLCPDDPETMNHYRDEDGCPDSPIAVPAPVDFTIRQSVYFNTAQSALTPESVLIIRDGVRQLGASPDMVIVLEGNTDGVGSDASNQRLSVQRANAVKDEMVLLGVDPSRIEVVGFGESRPIATNSTPEGRAQNRRVDARRK